MSLATDVAVSAAERLERSAGPAAGLAVWRRLATSTSGAELRGRAILGGLRCATAVRDLTALRDLALLWQTIDEGMWEEIFAACKELQRAGLGGCAIDLASAEAKRWRTARALYMVARCLDVANDSRAASAFDSALERAEKEGAKGLIHACRVRRAAWLARSPETLAEAIDIAKIAAPYASPAERLLLAGILLRSPSRFARTSAIGLLDDLVSGCRAGSLSPLARRALALAARHADDMADDITPLEIDRLLALFSRESIAREAIAVRDTVRLIDRLARANDRKNDAELEAALNEAAVASPELALLHDRARDILRGRFEPAVASPLVLGASAHPDWTAMLDAVVALRDSAWPRAAHALHGLAEAAQRGDRMPASLWTVAQVALGAESSEVTLVTERLVRAMMKTTSAAPPRGWLTLAQMLDASGMNELAIAARRSAVLAKEPGAAQALVVDITRLGWQFAESGDRSRAIERLREARALASTHRLDPGANPSM